MPLFVLRPFKIHKFLMEAEDQIQDKLRVPSPALLVLCGCCGHSEGTQPRLEGQLEGR